MEQQQLDLILDSLISPQGLFSVYRSGEIGKNPRARFLSPESLKRYDLGEYFGMEMKYRLSCESVCFQLLATSSTSFPYTYDWETMRSKTFRSPDVICELENFSYGHQQVSELGRAILQGQDVGPLEEGILKDCVAQDPLHLQVRSNLGNYFVAIGEFAQRLSKRDLSVGVKADVPYYGRLKRTG